MQTVEYTEKAPKGSKGMTLGQLRELVTKLDGAHEDSVVRAERFINGRARKISVDTAERLYDVGPRTLAQQNDPESPAGTGVIS